MSDDVKDPEQQTDAELAASIAAEQAKLTAAPPEETPAKEAAAATVVEFVAGDGTRYEAANHEELFAKITGALNNTKQAVKDRERQIHDLRQQTPKPVETPKPDEFDKEKYFAMVNEDPLAAQKYVNRFALGVENPEEVLPRIAASDVARQHTDAMANEVMRFYASPAGKEYVKVETKELNDLLVKHIGENGLNKDANGFRVAFYELRDAGKIPAAATEAEPATKRKAPPASAAGGGGTQQAEEPDRSSMTTQQMAAEMKKRGLSVSVS